MHVLLISTYELGHQPFGLASPAAWLREAGASVDCLDLAVQTLDEAAVQRAALIAVYLPMHTATRLALPLLGRIRAINPQAHVCGYGLYAPMNEPLLHSAGVRTILGGEFESGLVALYRSLVNGTAGDDENQQQLRIALQRQTFLRPDRSNLPDLANYANVQLPDGSQRVAGYTEATRGCKHLCRHCPVVPVYGGHFRVVQREVVLADIRQQVAAGAQHITFGDPDFFNGPGHALPLVEALYNEFPDLTYDVTIKVEHLLKHADALPTLKRTGCLFVTSAVEAIDEHILTIFDKHHTYADFARAVGLLRAAGLVLNPTFVTFTPWTTRAIYADFLRAIRDLDLVDHVAPIQYAIRLLIPAGSKLLELPEVQQLVGPFDANALCYRWAHPDPAMDQLYGDVLRTVQSSQGDNASRGQIFARIWKLVVGEELIARNKAQLIKGRSHSRALVPHMSEPWYC